MTEGRTARVDSGPAGGRHLGGHRDDMTEHSLDAAHSILHVRPRSALQRDDFAQLAGTIDPYIEENGRLAGIIVETPSFPGWDGLGAMAAHFQFVRGHQKHIGKIAIVTDAVLGNLAETLAPYFVSPTVRHFAAGEVEAARRWILNQTA